MRLSVKLPLFVGLAVSAAATTVGALAVRTAADSTTDQVLRSASDRAKVYAGSVTAHLDNARLGLEVTAEDDEVQSFAADPATARGVAHLLVTQSEVYEYVMAVDLTGAISLVEPPALEAGPTTPTVVNDAWFREAVASGTTVVSDLHISPVTQRPSVVVATPVHSTAGDLVGMWVGGLELTVFSAFGQGDRGTDRQAGSGLLADANGLIVAHRDNPRYVESQTDFSSVTPVRRALAGRSGSGRWHNHIEDVEKMGAWLPLEIGGSSWAVVYSTPVDEALSSVPQLTRRIVVASLLLAASLALIGALIGWRLMRPLRRLADVAARVAEGDLSTRAPDGSGEIGELSTQLNAMLVALDEQDQHLRQRNADAKAAIGELDAFAYAVSHDLRAPLRAIDGFSQILLDDYGATLDPEAHGHLDRVRSAAQRMGLLIDDLLSLSRVAQLELKRRDTDLTEITRQIVDDLRAAEPDRDVTVVVDDGLRAVVDPRLAEVVLRNLLDNAWKFTAHTPNPTVHVGASAPGQLFVTDNGAGFDMAHVDRLFTAFQRLHATSRFPGTGVGLATVKRIVRRHGGEIHAHGAPDQGATFTFTFGPPPPTQTSTSGPPRHGAQILQEQP